tara:strand:+ start:6121 stop:6972 length:852 start_codon:yes stop_codon:yes gene_type:complete
MIKNQLKTVVLLGLLTGVLLWVGNLMGGMQGLAFALVFAIMINFGSYWFSDKIVLAMYRAKEVNEESSHRLFKLVKEVSHLANVPMPKVYIIPTHNSNAFATGRNPKHAAVACTEGILELMNDDELKGVIAHEVAHIKNRDTLIQAVAATIAGVISYVAMIARWGAIFGGFGGRDRRGGSGLELLVLAIVTPIIAAIIQLAISRSREYIADESAAKTLHNSYGLADALEKLEHDAARNPMRFGSPSTAHLFISNPFRGRGMMRLLSTHPPLQERVKKLRGMRV